MLTEKPSFTLSDPMIITPRLLPGIQVAEATLSAEPHMVETSTDRAHFRFHLDIPGVGTWASSDSFVTVVKPDWNQAAAEALDVVCDVIGFEEVDTDDDSTLDEMEPLVSSWVRDNAFEFSIAHEKLATRLETAPGMSGLAQEAAWER